MFDAGDGVYGYCEVQGRDHEGCGKELVYLEHSTQRGVRTEVPGWEHKGVRDGFGYLGYTKYTGV